MRSRIELFLRAMNEDLQISNSDDWDLDWDLDIFDAMIEGVILISFFSGVPNSTLVHGKKSSISSTTTKKGTQVLDALVQ